VGSKPDYILELGGGSTEQPTEQIEVDGSFRGRPWLAVHWRCCGVYSRVYRNRQGTAYRGHCPRCAKPIRVKVSPSGTRDRFFEAW
jgi:hypothetical protein